MFRPSDTMVMAFIVRGIGTVVPTQGLKQTVALFGVPPSRHAFRPLLLAMPSCKDAARRRLPLS